MQHSSAWRGVAVVAALTLSSFAFNTAENLPIGLLPLMAADLHTSAAHVGYLVTGYGLTVAACSLPLAQATRGLPRRHVLAAVLAVLVLATWATVWAPDYPVLLAARVATAAAQAVFWAVQGPTALSMFSPAVRGRVIAVLSVGGSIAAVGGVPAGTWLGQHHGWRQPFWILAGVAVAALAAIIACLPTSRPEESHGSYGVDPDRRRFGLVVMATAMSVTGMFCGFTYISAYLTGSAGFTAAAVSALLAVFGAAGIAGVVLAGPHLGRRPRAALAVPAAAQAAALLALWGGARRPAVVVAALVLLGASAAPVFMAAQNRVLHHAPGRTELAAAANSAAFNVGVAAGAGLGGALLGTVGVRGTVLIGASVSAAAAFVLVGEAFDGKWRIGVRPGVSESDAAVAAQ